MSDETEDLEVIDPEDVPEDAFVLQCGRVVGDDGVIGRIDEDDREGGA